MRQGVGVNARLSQVALRQGGVFTAQDALQSGYSRDAIRHRVDSGRWTRVGRGIFAAAGDLPAETLPRVLRECWTALLAHPDAVVGFGVAAELNGLDTYRPLPGLELVRSSAARRTPDLAQVRVTAAALPAEHVREPRGVPATSPARTAADIARRGTLREGVVVLDSAMRLGCAREELDLMLETCRGWPGIRSLRLALEVADQGAESALESLAHVMQREEGIPRPQTQVCIYDAAGLIGRVDDYWAAEATVGESDGMFKYDEPGSLRREKLRQERLERTGLQVVRVTYADVTRSPAATAQRYREAFERGGRRLAWRPIAVRTAPSPRLWGQVAG